MEGSFEESTIDAIIVRNVWSHPDNGHENRLLLSNSTSGWVDITGWQLFGGDGPA